jgi:tRNA A-37 threonylcarbamoyl transferase component Bud32
VVKAQWQEIEAHFLAAVELPPAARDAYLTSACGTDGWLRKEVDALLRAEMTADAAIGSVLANVAEDFAEFVVRSHVGERVGAYRLVDLIGQGGMGTVYLAERADEAYRARVAIKFVRGGYAAPELTRRFLAERQMLADLNHPGIARLLDGGATVDGTPYVVLEFIDGVPIDEWCDTRALPLRDRIELLLKVCEAVQYAHDHKVIHRDLKPSNILVTADGTPKLVDFGIAKLVSEGSEQQAVTALQMLTPAYASPEQIRGDPVSVTSDVYSLGVVIYKLLTGRLPIDLSNASAGEAERRICQELPLELSRAATGFSLTWRRELASDLDATVLRALEKRAELRPLSVSALAAELRASLSAPPGPRRWRTLVRVVRRRKVASVAVALVAIALVTATGRALVHRRDALIAFRMLPPLAVDPGIPAPQTVLDADVNGDGRGDLVWNYLDDSTNQLAVGLGQPDGTFVMQPPVSHPHRPTEGWHRSVTLHVADINGDGRDELLWLRLGEGLFNLVFVGYHSADGTFRFAESFHFGHPTLRWGAWRALVADFDGDGKDDLVFNHLAADNQIRAFRSRGDGTFAELTPITHFAKTWSGYRAFVGDVDGDRRDDVLWNDVPVWANRTYVARSWGDRHDLLSQQDHTVTDGWSEFRPSVADIDGDGKSDVVWSKIGADTVTVFVALGQSTALFRYLPVQSLALPARARLTDPIVGDFNGDGRTDFLWHASEANSVLVMRASRGGRFSMHYAPGNPDGARGDSVEVLPVDVNADGRDDLVWVDRASRRLYVAVAAPRS